MDEMQLFHDILPINIMALILQAQWAVSKSLTGRIWPPGLSLPVPVLSCIQLCIMVIAIGLTGHAYFFFSPPLCLYLELKVCELYPIYPVSDTVDPTRQQIVIELEHRSNTLSLCHR